MSRTVAAIVALVVANACTNTVEASPSPTAPTSTSVSTATSTPSSRPTVSAAASPTAGDERLVRALVDLARAPSGATLAAVPFADKVALGLADRIVTTRAATELAQTDSWRLAADQFRAHVGPFSALDLLARSNATTISVGPHPHCASPPVAAPAGFAALRRVSVQPTGIDTCILWWTVDLFVSSSGRIEAITLDLWEP